MPDEFLTPAEVAEILKLKKNTVYEMIKRGDLNANKLGKQLRISRSDLDAYLSGQTTSQATVTNVSTAQPSMHSPLGATPLDAQGESLIVCGQDMILDKLCDRINENENGILMLRSHKGSYNGLYALYNRQVHIATCHLWDPETDNYNLPYIPKLLPGLPVRVFHILNRKQGFYVPKGNPKKLVSFEDFTRNDITFANRERGCGTRILLDNKLNKLGIDRTQIRGYYSERNSHLECATAVAVGQADFAIGNERTSLQLPDIDFVPLQTESYDLVIPEDLMQRSSVQMVLAMLRSQDFQTEVLALGGYDVTNMGQEIS